MKPFINKYKWERTHFPSEKYHWEKSEKNNVKVALNVLYAKINIYIYIYIYILLMFESITQLVKNKLFF